MLLRSLLFLALIILSACNTKPPLDVTAATKPSFSNDDPFIDALRVGYLEFYEYESSIGNDQKARKYGRKALAAASSMAPEMEGLFEQDIPLDRLNNLLGAKYFLESAFVNGTKDIDPNTSAQAQLMFDCWTDQEYVRTQKNKKQQQPQTPCQKEFNRHRSKLEGVMAQIRQEERMQQQARIEQEKRLIAARHQQQLSRALAEQKKKLRKLPEYSLIFFRFNSTKLGVTGMSILDKVAKDIELFKPRKVIISGNTDLIGGYEYNMKLAMSRGNAVADYLVKKHNIDQTILDIKAYGENNPRVGQKKDVRNRYVQIIFKMDNKFYY